MQATKFSTHLNGSDYLKANIVSLFLEWRFWLSMLWYYAVLVVILAFFTKQNFLIALAIVVAGAIGFKIYRYYEFRRMIQKERFFLEKLYWEIDPDFIRIKSETHELTMEIKKLVRVVETSRYFFLWADKRNYYLLPKKDIPAADLNTIRHLIKP